MHLSVVVITSCGFTSLSVTSILALVLFGGAEKNRIIGMGLDMLLQILGALESLSAEVAFVRLERHMDPDVRGDMITLYCGGAARVPSTGEVEVVSRLATNMFLADVLKESLWRSAFLRTFLPLTREVVVASSDYLTRHIGSLWGRKLLLRLALVLLLLLLLLHRLLVLVLIAGHIRENRRRQASAVVIGPEARLGV